MTTRISHELATNVIREIKSCLRFKFQDKKISMRLRLIPVGSYRRKKESLKDIDMLVIIPKRYEKQEDKFLESVILKDNKYRNLIESMEVNKKMQGAKHSGYKLKIKGIDGQISLDLFIVLESEIPFALLHYTGDYTFNIRVRAHVKKLGWLLNQYGLFDAKTKKRINGKQIKSERDIFKIIGVTYKSPKQRSENR
jgi:DNA polymerase (family X)